MLKTTFRIDFISTLFFKFQGSALYVYNDAMFSKEDWKGIRSAGVSQKRDKEEKVGKFGIGFSSVYHFTGVEGFKFMLYLSSRLPLDHVGESPGHDGPLPAAPHPPCPVMAAFRGGAEEEVGGLG